jgi:uncharacterized protein YutE (UPF0331/DUF86 family)
MVDNRLVLRKLTELNLLHSQIREYRSITVSQYAADWKSQRIIERTIQMMVEIALDIANHLIADRNYRNPKGYADSFKVLHENRILDAKLAARMEKMAKFRNIIVHNYDKVDAEIVVGILKKNLSDFDTFKEAVVDFLDLEK